MFGIALRETFNLQRLGMTSDKKLDVNKVDAALKKTGRTAISGSREARSGRLLHRDSQTDRFIDKRLDKSKKEVTKKK